MGSSAYSELRGWSWPYPDPDRVDPTPGTIGNTGLVFANPARVLT